MKVEAITAPSHQTLAQLIEPIPIRQKNSFTRSSSLYSPHDSGLKEMVTNFFNWIWESICSLFSWCFPKKKDALANKTEKDHPPQELVKADAMARQRARANQNRVPALIINLAIGGATAKGIDYVGILGNRNFNAFVANKSVEGSTYVLEKIATCTLPQISSEYIKAASLSISATSVWMVCRYLGHDLNYLYLVSTGFKAYQIISKSAEARKLQREQNLNTEAS